MKSYQKIGLRKSHGYESEFDNKKVEKYVNYLVKWMQEKVQNARAKGIVVGISGGIDSAVVFALAKRAFGLNAHGLIMPIDDMSFDMPHIKKLEAKMQTNFKIIDLKEAFLALSQKVPDLNNKMAISNIKPRLRMTTLYAYAQNNNLLVSGTDNRDEYYIGYFTKWGDGGVDILPTTKLLKSEVRAIAKYLDIPEEIINKKPSAGLWEGQNDEDELGFSYQELDNFLLGNKNQVSAKSLDRIKHMHKISQHKRDKIYQPLEIEKII